MGLPWCLPSRKGADDLMTGMTAGYVGNANDQSNFACGI
jgi:hypothetical protein